MDAFGEFTRLWSSDQNPFQYLLDVKDESGKPLYEPHPSPVRYPLISVYKRGIRYRAYQNASYHDWRHINWPTVSADVDKCQLGNVTTSHRPLAIDFRYQVDHYSMRPDTQAFFTEKFLWEMWRTGGVPQTWILADYPGWGQHLIRLFMEGDVENATPEAPPEGEHVEYRTTLNLVVEGWSIDLDYKVYPALWELVLRETASPDEITTVDNVVASVDLRLRGHNATLDSRPDVPSDAECQSELADLGAPFVRTIDFAGRGIAPAGGVGGITLS